MEVLLLLLAQMVGVGSIHGDPWYHSQLDKCTFAVPTTFLLLYYTIKLKLHELEVCVEFLFCSMFEL